MRDPIAAKLTDLAQRCFSLERRFRELSGRVVEYLYQLKDVDITYEGGDAVADGDVLTYDANAAMWINAAPTGGGGGDDPAAFSAWGYDDEYYIDWSLETVDSGALSPVTGSGITFGFVPTKAGIWHVTASVIAGTGTVQIQSGSTAGGWQHDPDDNQCLLLPSSPAGTSVSADMLCLWADGTKTSVIPVVLHTTGTIDWRFQAHLIRPYDAYEGDCGD